MNKFYAISGKMLFYAFFILGTVFFIFDIGNKSSMILLFLSLILSGGLEFLFKRKKVANAEFLWFLTNIAIWAGLFGEMGLYDYLNYYDKGLHIFIGILIAEIVYQSYGGSLKPNKDVVFYSVLGLLTIWEIYEYTIFAFFNYPSMGVYLNGIEVMSPLDDTMVDLIFGAIGSLVYLFFKKEGLDKKTKEVELKGRIFIKKQGQNARAYIKNKKERILNLKKRK